MSIFRRRRHAQHWTSPYADAAASDEDIPRVESLMAEYQAVMQQGTSLWPMLDRLADYGGAPSEMGLMHAYQRTSTDEQRTALIDEGLSRPWRWLASATQLAHKHGEHLLAARILVFAQMCYTDLAQQLATNTKKMGPLDGQTLRTITETACRSATELDDYEIVFQDGEVSVTGHLVATSLCPMTFTLLKDHGIAINDGSVE